MRLFTLLYLFVLSPIYATESCQSQCQWNKGDVVYLQQESVKDIEDKNFIWVVMDSCVDSSTQSDEEQISVAPLNEQFILDKKTSLFYSKNISEMKISMGEIIRHLKSAPILKNPALFSQNVLKMIDNHSPTWTFETTIQNSNPLNLHLESVPDKDSLQLTQEGIFVLLEKKENAPNAIVAYSLVEDNFSPLLGKDFISILNKIPKILNNFPSREYKSGDLVFLSNQRAGIIFDPHSMEEDNKLKNIYIIKIANLLEWLEKRNGITLEDFFLAENLKDINVKLEDLHCVLDLENPIQEYSCELRKNLFSPKSRQYSTKISAKNFELKDSREIIIDEGQIEFGQEIYVSTEYAFKPLKVLAIFPMMPFENTFGLALSLDSIDNDKLLPLNNEVLKSLLPPNVYWKNSLRFFRDQVKQCYSACCDGIKFVASNPRVSGMLVLGLGVSLLTNKLAMDSLFHLKGELSEFEKYQSNLKLCIHPGIDISYRLNCLEKLIVKK